MRNLFYPYLQRTRPPTTASATAKPLILVIPKAFETPDDALTPSVLDADGADPEADAEDDRNEEEDNDDGDEDGGEDEYEVGESGCCFPHTR